MEAKWDKSLSVSEDNIDAQHKKLLGEIDRITKILQSGDMELGPLREAIHFLYVYTEEHFQYEEKYMEDNNYPKLEQHKSIHQEFMRFYEDFNMELREKLMKKSFSTVDIDNLFKKIKGYLTEWWINHMKKEDQKYAKYIKAHSK